jgi:hypothetical protein
VHRGVDGGRCDHGEVERRHDAAPPIAISVLDRVLHRYQQTPADRRSGSSAHPTWTVSVVSAREVADTTASGCDQVSVLQSHSDTTLSSGPYSADTKHRYSGRTQRRRWSWRRERCQSASLAGNAVERRLLRAGHRWHGEDECRLGPTAERATVHHTAGEHNTHHALRRMATWKAISDTQRTCR